MSQKSSLTLEHSPSSEPDRETSESVEQKIDKERYIEDVAQNAEKALLSYFDGRYEFYDQNHEVKQFIEEIFETLLTEEEKEEYEVEITSSWDKINAAALPDKTIILSDILIDFADSIEELQGVLHHELGHIRDEHIQEKLEQGSSDLLSSIGEDRMNEYYADLHHLEHSDSFNHVGKLKFLEKLRQKEKQKEDSGGGSDLTHGDIWDRIIFQRRANQMIDAPKLSTDTRPIPDEIKNALALNEPNDISKTIDYKISTLKSKEILPQIFNFSKKDQDSINDFFENQSIKIHSIEDIITIKKLWENLKNLEQTGSENKKGVKPRIESKLESEKTEEELKNFQTDVYFEIESLLEATEDKNRLDELKEWKEKVEKSPVQAFEFKRWQLKKKIFEKMQDLTKKEVNKIEFNDIQEGTKAANSEVLQNLLLGWSGKMDISPFSVYEQKYITPEPYKTKKVGNERMYDYYPSLKEELFERFQNKQEFANLPKAIKELATQEDNLDMYLMPSNSVQFFNPILEILKQGIESDYFSEKGQNKYDKFQKYCKDLSKALSSLIEKNSAMPAIDPDQKTIFSRLMSVWGQKQAEKRAHKKTEQKNKPTGNNEILSAQIEALYQLAKRGEIDSQALFDTGQVFPESYFITSKEGEEYIPSNVNFITSYAGSITEKKKVQLNKENFVGKLIQLEQKHNQDLNEKEKIYLEIPRTELGYRPFKRLEELGLELSISNEEEFDQMIADITSAAKKTLPVLQEEIVQKVYEMDKLLDYRDSNDLNEVDVYSRPVNVAKHFIKNLEHINHQNIYKYNQSSDLEPLIGYNSRFKGIKNKYGPPSLDNLLQIFNNWFEIDNPEDYDCENPEEKFYEELLRTDYEFLLYETLKEDITNHSKEEFFTKFKKLFKEVNDPRQSQEVAEKIFETFDFNLENEQDCQYLISASALLIDSDLAGQIQANAIEGIFGNLNKDWELSEEEKEKLENLLFSDPRTSGIPLTKIRQKFVQEVIDNIEKMDEVYEYTKERIKNRNESKKEVGKATVSKKILSVFKNHFELKEIFEIALSTGKNDEKIKTKMLEQMISSKADSNKDEITLETDDLLHIDKFTERVLHMSENTKFGLIRELLIGETGMLHEEKYPNDSRYEPISGRKPLINLIFENNVVSKNNQEEKQLITNLKNGLENLAESEKNAVDLYFLLSPLIQEMSFRPPKEEKDWEEIITTETIENIFANLEPNIRSIRQDKKEEVVEEILDSVNKKIIENQPDSDIPQPTKNSAYIYSLLEDYLPEQDPTEKVHLTPYELIKKVASEAGAPGVRILQIMGMYIDLPDRAQKEFSEVYDSIEGQNKLTAHKTISKEMGENNYKDEIKKLGEPIGGGSLVTVYKAETKNGNEVIKVQNPNAKFHAKEVCNVFREVVRNNLDQYEKTGEALLTALDDIQEWIENDINFEGFEAKDNEFREYQKRFNEQIDSDYDIKVPQSYETDSKKIHREEHISGLNLTDIEKVKQKHDLEEIVSLITKNYMHQLGSGLVHSDFHPGNIRITEDNEIAILDRNYFLNIEDDSPEQELIFGLLNAESEQEVLEVFFDFLELEKSDRRDWKKEILENTDTSKRTAKEIKNLIIQTRAKAIKEGKDFPIEVTLVMKNIMALNDLAQKTEQFDSVLDAFKAQ